MDLARPRDAVAADLARLREVVHAAVEGVDVHAVFADAALCDAADAFRETLTATIAATEAEPARRVLARISRLELLELQESDLEFWNLPPRTPLALRVAVKALKEALQAAPELERAHCASAVAAAATAPPSDGWQLTFTRAQNGPTCPKACEGALVVAWRPFLEAGTAGRVLERLMPRLATAAGQLLSSVRTPRAAPSGGDEEEIDEEEDEDDDLFDADDCASIVAPDGRRLIQVAARNTLFRGYHDYAITVLPGAGVTAATVCSAARATTMRSEDDESGDDEGDRCDVMPHGTKWLDVAAPAAWDASTAPRLTVRIVTGTAHGRAVGALASRFDLHAEAAAPREAKRQRAEGGRERIARALVTYSNCGMGTRGPTLELLDVKEGWRRRGVGTALMGVVRRFVVDATSPRPARVPVTLQLCDVDMGRLFFEACGVHWLDHPRKCTEGVINLYAPAHCTCGNCVGGVLSRVFAEKMESQADMHQDSVLDDIKELTNSAWRMNPEQPLSAEQTSGLWQCIVRCFPPATLEAGLTLPMLVALRHAFLAIRHTCEAEELPTPAAVLSHWMADGTGVDANAAAAASQLLSTLGSSLERVIAQVIDAVKYADANDEFAYMNEDSYYVCENDYAADAVRDAALGAAFPRCFPGCLDCESRH